MARPESLDYAALFEEAWEDDSTTSVDLRAVDVNDVLGRRYTVHPPAHFTGASLWDMEVRKAAAPDIYLPTLVRPGSVERFPSEYRERREYFTRVSEQGLWLDGSRYGTVIEHVQLDHGGRRAFFLGAESYGTEDGREFKAGTRQPLFHVEHSVGGTEDTPLNIWRIVLLTDGFDKELAEHFATVGQDPHLREFNEVYLRRVLHRDLRRKAA